MCDIHSVLISGIREKCKKNLENRQRPVVEAFFCRNHLKSKANCLQISWCKHQKNRNAAPMKQLHPSNALNWTQNSFDKFQNLYDQFEYDEKHLYNSKKLGVMSVKLGDYSMSLKMKSVSKTKSSNVWRYA